MRYIPGFHTVLVRSRFRPQIVDLHEAIPSMDLFGSSGLSSSRLASTNGLITVTFLAALVSAIAFVSSRIISHPLKHIPGSTLATLSTWPLFWQSIRGKRANWIVQQHQKHGPVIRIAPHKVCISSDTGIKLIYGNKAVKTHVYDTFRYRGVKMCIGLPDVKSAHSRRKALLPAFSRQNLLEMEPVIRNHLQHFLDWLEKFEVTNTPVDTFKWFRYLTFDVITDIAFGQQIGMLQSGDSHFIGQVELRNQRNGLVRQYPTII